MSQATPPQQLETAEVQQLHPYEDILDLAPNNNNKFKVAGTEATPDAMEEDNRKTQGFKVAMLPRDNPNVQEEGGASKVPHYTEVVKKKKSEQSDPKDYNKLQHVPEPTLTVPPPPTSMPTTSLGTYSALDCPPNKGGPQYEPCPGESSSPPPPLPPYDSEVCNSDKIYYNETAVKRAAKMS